MLQARKSPRLRRSIDGAYRQGSDTCGDERNDDPFTTGDTPFPPLPPPVPAIARKGRKVYEMFELPRIRIEIENMRYQIVHAFASHNDEIERAVDQELTRIIANYPFGEEIASIASQVLTQAIKREIEDFLLYGAGRQVLSDSVDSLITSKLTMRAADFACTCRQIDENTINVNPACPVHGKNR